MFPFALWLLILFFSAINSQAQQLVLIDQLELGDLASIKDVKIDKKGNRYYALDGTRPEWKINGRAYNLIEETNRTPSDDQSYILHIEASDAVDVFYPGGSTLLLTDTSYIVFHSHAVDTLVSEDTTLISPWVLPNFYFGDNLSIWNRSFSGKLNYAKLWPVPIVAEINPMELRHFDKNYFISSQFYSLDSFIADSIVVLPNTGDDEMFMAKISNDFLFTDAMQIMTDESCLVLEYDLDDGLIFGVATCETDRLKLCDIEMRNQAHFVWRSGMPVWFTLNTNLECLAARTAKYDFNVIAMHDALVMDYYLLSIGSFSSNYLAIDQDTIVANPADEDGFLSIMDKNLNSKELLKLDSTMGYSTFESLEKVDAGRFLLAGYCSEGRFSLNGVDVDVPSSPFRRNGFVALMDTSLMVESIMTIEGQPRDLIKGQDNQIYLYAHIRDSTSQITARLYLIDGLSATNNSFSKHEMTISWNIYPSLLKAGEILNMECVEASLRIDDVHVYDVAGNLLLADVNNKNSISTNGLSAGVYIIQAKFSNGQVDSRRVVIYE